MEDSFDIEIRRADTRIELLQTELLRRGEKIDPSSLKDELMYEMGRRKGLRQGHYIKD